MKLKLTLLTSLLLAAPVYAGEIDPGVRRIQGTYNGSNQSIIATPGVGKRICVRSLYLSSEDVSADWQFNSRTGVTNTALTPNADYLANSGVVLLPDDSCWVLALENEALVITTSAAVDVFGTYKIVPK